MHRITPNFSRNFSERWLKAVKGSTYISNSDRMCRSDAGIFPKENNFILGVGVP
jgi:hypothetical protein